MAVLSLDLGWAYGYCLWRRGDRLTSGVIKLAHQSPLDGVRLLAFRQWLTATLDQLHQAGEALDDIVYEQITFVGRDNGPEAMHAHGKQLGALESWAALKKIAEPRGIPWNTVKKFVTGHGSAARQLVLKTIQQRFPEVVDHNQASAVAVMLTAMDKFPAQAEAVR